MQSTRSSARMRTNGPARGGAPAADQPSRPGSDHRGLRRACARASTMALAMALALSFGCASGRGMGSRGSGKLVRPEADATYDVLVAEVAAREGDPELALDALDRAIEKDPDSAYLHYRASRFAAQLEDVDRAIAYGEAGMALDPGDIEGRRFLGRLYLHQREYDRVELTLRDADERPLDSEAALLLFQMYIERGQMASALTTARLLLEDDPENLGGYMAVATVYERLRQYEDAEEVLRQGLEYHPDRFVLYSRLARVRRSAGDRAGEIDVYREALEQHPDHHGMLLSLGEAQIAAGDMEGAVETYRQLVASHPGDVQAVKRLASLEYAAGDPEAAAARFAAAVEANPDRPDLAFSLGQVERALGRNEAALVAFDRVPSSHPLYGESRMQVASILEEEGDLAGALVELERLRVIRDERAIVFHTASLRARTGDLEGGIALLESMLADDPGDQEVLYEIGVLYGMAKENAKAIEYMQRVLDENPDNAHALNYIGYTLAERGEDLDRAERLIVRALELSPDDGYIADSLGWVYYMQARPLMEHGRRDDGLALLERAREQLRLADDLTGGDPVVSEHLGDVYLLMNERTRALEYYERAVGQKYREAEQPELIEKLDRLRGDLGSGAPGTGAGAGEAVDPDADHQGGEARDETPTP